MITIYGLEFPIFQNGYVSGVKEMGPTACLLFSIPLGFSSILYLD